MFLCHFVSYIIDVHHIVCVFVTKDIKFVSDIPSKANYIAIYYALRIINMLKFLVIRFLKSGDKVGTVLQATWFIHPINLLLNLRDILLHNLVLFICSYHFIINSILMSFEIGYLSLYFVQWVEFIHARICLWLSFVELVHYIHFLSSNLWSSLMKLDHCFALMISSAQFFS